MFHHRQHNRLRLWVMAWRDVRALTDTANEKCPGCRSKKVYGGDGTPYGCRSCGALWQ